MRICISGTRVFPWLLWGLLAAALALAGCHHAHVVHEARTVAVPVNVAAGTNGLKNEERFPTGTVFVMHHDGSTYFGKDDFLGRVQPTAGFYPSKNGTPPYALNFSPNGRQVLVFNISTHLLQTQNLYSLRTIDAMFAWWEGDKVAYLDPLSDHMFVGGHLGPARIGKTLFVAADTKGRFLLGLHSLGPGDSGTTNYREQLWKRSGQEHFKFITDLVTEEFDPEEGYPCHLAALSPQAVVFGVPLGGGLWYDWIFVRCGGNASVPLQDRQGRSLVFGPQGPVMAGDSIVGLATGSDITGVRYLYRVTSRGAWLRQVPSNVVLVTYDPVLGVGEGIAGQSGVIVRYDVTDFGQRVKLPSHNAS